MRVIEGTKGGRPREVHPADLDRARTEIERAQATLEASGQRHLVTRADGTATTGLRQALGIYRSLCHRAGIQSHGARHAFARERMQAYRNEGFSEREARVATSQDLGHDDGRGRYIERMCERSMNEPQNDSNFAVFVLPSVRLPVAVHRTVNLRSRTSNLSTAAFFQ